MCCLNLSRRIGERIIIGEHTVLKVVSISSHQVMLQFVAPKNIRIDREEIRILKDRDANEALPEPEQWNIHKASQYFPVNSQGNH